MYKRIFIITTEPSGDDLGYLLLKKIKKKFPDAKICGVGGLKMETLKFSSIYPISEFSVNGIIEVLKRINFFRKKINQIIFKIREFNPDLIITIDSPSFCFRVIKRIQSLRAYTKFVHLVTPTVWAWKRYRAKQFGKNYDLLLSLFRFEPDYFKKFNKKTFFIGHPIFFRKEESKILHNVNNISLFPGSRINEVVHILPTMLESTVINNKKNNLNIKIITLNNLVPIVRNLSKNYSVEILSDNKIISQALNTTDLAIAASGTVILQLASKYIPMIVVYKCNAFTGIIVRLLVKLRWANIVNILFNKEVIPELLFSKCNKKQISRLTDRFINDRKLRARQLNYFSTLRKKMLNNGRDPMTLAIRHISNLLKK